MHYKQKRMYKRNKNIENVKDPGNVDKLAKISGS